MNSMILQKINKYKIKIGRKYNLVSKSKKPADFVKKEWALEAHTAYKCIFWCNVAQICGQSSKYHISIVSNGWFCKQLSYNLLGIIASVCRKIKSINVSKHLLIRIIAGSKLIDIKHTVPVVCNLSVYGNIKFSVCIIL